jgi:hypothetical protein
MEKLKSRKLAAFVLVTLANLVNGYFDTPIDLATMQQVNELAIYYILGQGAVDALGKWNTPLASFGTQLGQKAASEVAERKESSNGDAETLP